jgi:hypothetical protein
MPRQQKSSWKPLEQPRVIIFSDIRVELYGISVFQQNHLEKAILRVEGV